MKYNRDYEFTSEKSEQIDNLEKLIKNGRQSFSWDEVNYVLDNKEQYEVLLKRTGDETHQMRSRTGEIREEKMPTLLDIIKDEVRFFKENQNLLLEQQVSETKECLVNDKIPSWEQCSLLLTQDKGMTEVGYKESVEHSNERIGDRMSGGSMTITYKQELIDRLKNKVNKHEMWKDEDKRQNDLKSSPEQDKVNGPAITRS